MFALTINFSQIHAETMDTDTSYLIMVKSAEEKDSTMSPT